MASKKGNKKLIPKEFVTLFKVCRSRLLVLEVARNQNRKPAFSVKPMTMIPEPNEKLQQLLLDYSLMNILQFPPKPKLGKKKRSKLKPINSFIAFRSFYSRAILDPEYQRELSCKLAKLWKEEVHKETWEQYTLSYNNYLLDSNNKLSFVDWLLDVLNLNLDTDILNDMPNKAKTPKLESGTIQDVYIMKSYC